MFKVNLNLLNFVVSSIVLYPLLGVESGSSPPSPSVESGENGGLGDGLSSAFSGSGCCWAFFTVELAFRDQVKFSVKWTPRNFVFFTISTGEPWIFSGSWSLWALWKSTTISLVLYIFRNRLLTLHQVISCSTFSLHDDSLFLSMRPTTVTTGDFLGTGIMVVVLKHDGTVALLREMLKMSVRTSASWSAHPLSTLLGMLSWPAALCGFTLCRVGV